MPPQKKKKQFQRTTNKPNMPKKSSCIFTSFFLLTNCRKFIITPTRCPGVCKKNQPLQPIAMLLHHRFEHLRVPFVSGLQAIKGAMYQGHEFRIAPRPAEKKKTHVFCCGSILFLGGGKFYSSGILFWGRVVICGGDRTEKKVVVLY